MKKSLILLMCLLGKYVSAQYFQHRYGNAATVELNAQFVPSSDVNAGYMMAGRSNGTPAGALRVNLVRPDNNGNIPGAPYFNNVYLITDASANVWPSWATSIAEINAGGGVFDYAVAGVTINPISTLPELLIMRVNATGGVMYVKSFTLAGYSLKDPKIKMALNGIDILVTGRCIPVGNPQDVFIFSINSNTGNANWGFAYDMGPNFDDIGRDIVENPYAPAGAPEIIVVGQSSNDGLFFKVNGNTGASIAGSAVRYNLTSNQELVSIKVSANPLCTSGFVVAGNVDMTVSSLSWNVWTMLIDQNGVITWSTDHDSNNAGAQNVCNEIMERLNTIPAYEYYTIGTIAQSATDDDVQVLKLNNNGMLVANGEFWYGVTTEMEKGMSIGFSNTGGFTASGSTTVGGGGPQDQLFINAYFNGITACNYGIKNPSSTSNGPTPSYPSITDLSSSSDYPLNASISTFNETPICSLNVVGGGSNAFSIRTPKADLFNFDIAANGQSNNNGGVVTLKLENNHSANIEAYMIDMMGRRISCKIVYTGSGKDWQLTASGVTAPGLYYIVLSDGVERSTKAYLVK